MIHDVLRLMFSFYACLPVCIHNGLFLYKAMQQLQYLLHVKYKSIYKMCT